MGQPHSWVRQPNKYLWLPCWATTLKKDFSTPGWRRLPLQVLQSIIKSYFCFSVCKALQSLNFGIFSSDRSSKVLFLIKSKYLDNKNVNNVLK